MKTSTPPTTAHSLLAALNLAGWQPARTERCEVRDALHVEDPKVPLRRPSKRLGVDPTPRPAVPIDENRLMDVYGDIFEVGNKEVEHGMFGRFKVESQTGHHSPTVVGVKQMDLHRHAALGGVTLPAVTRECRFMHLANSALKPYATRYTFHMRQGGGVPLDEARQRAKIGCSNMERVMPPKAAYLFMPLAAGGDVLSLTNAFIDHAPAALEVFARHVLVCILQEFERLHAAGTVHSDVKPENFFVECTGNVLLGDYGTASQRGTTEPMPIGTLAYCAPEQFNDSYTERADIYSLAVCVIAILGTNPLNFGDAPRVMMAELAHRRRWLLEQWRQEELTGVPAFIPAEHRDQWSATEEDPFNGVKTAMDLAKQASPGLMPLLLGMLSPQPEERPTARKTLAIMQRDGLMLSDKDRGDLIRALFTIKPGTTRKRALNVAKKAQPAAPRPSDGERESPVDAL